MKKVPEEYEGRGKGDQKGWHFKLIKRTDDVALYRKTNAQGIVRYDLMVVMRYKVDRHIKERLVNRAGDEYLPSSRQWGSKGWTFFKESDALSKMGEVVERMKEKRCETERQD